jgi:hypothetical protein
MQKGGIMTKKHRFHHVILPDWAQKLIPHPRSRADWRTLEIEAEIRLEVRLALDYFIQHLDETIQIEFPK